LPHQTGNSTSTALVAGTPSGTSFPQPTTGYRGAAVYTPVAPRTFNSYCGTASDEAEQKTLVVQLSVNALNPNKDLLGGHFPEYLIEDRKRRSARLPTPPIRQDISESPMFSTLTSNCDICGPLVRRPTPVDDVGSPRSITASPSLLGDKTLIKGDMDFPQPILPPVTCRSSTICPSLRSLTTPGKFEDSFSAKGTSVSSTFWLRPSAFLAEYC
jgi:hypothetical protein